MSGRRFLLDTNAVIVLLRDGGPLVPLLEMAEWVGISIITLVEFLAFPGLDDDARLCFEDFLSRVDVVDLTRNDRQLVEAATRLRQAHRLRLPDAVIAASALQSGAELVTGDDEFRKVPGLSLLQP